MTILIIKHAMALICSKEKREARTSNNRQSGYKILPWDGKGKRERDGFFSPNAQKRREMNLPWEKRRGGNTNESGFLAERGGRGESKRYFPSASKLRGRGGDKHLKIIIVIFKCN